MTIDEAIKKLEELGTCLGVKNPWGLYPAVTLGKEALKRISDSRVAGWNPINRTLPGETAE